MKIHEHNAETNKVVLRDATKEELAQNAIDEAKALAKAEAEAAKAAAKAALLERLGITADEAALLLA
jgi:hypothetical protein